MGLLYGEAPPGPRHAPGELPFAVTLEACAGAPATAHPGGLVVAGRRCVTLEVRVGDEPRARRLAVPFGVDACPDPAR